MTETQMLYQISKSKRDIFKTGKRRDKTIEWRNRAGN
jgi:hypothetical protein